MATQLQAAQRADRRARLLAQLMRREGTLLRSQAARHCGGAVEVDDVLQDACVIFLRRFDAPPDAALPWLMVVIRHRAWQLAARRRRYEAPIPLTARRRRRAFLRRLERMSSEQRLKAARKGRFSRGELTLWAAHYPEEAPLVNGEYPWIALGLAALDAG